MSRAIRIWPRTVAFVIAFISSVVQRPKTCRHSCSIELTIGSLSVGIVSAILDMAEEALQPQSLPEDDLVDLLIDGARYDDMDDVKMALDQHINVNATDSSGRTGRLQHARRLSCKHSTLQGLKLLKLCLSDVALHMASANGHASIVMALIDAGAVSICNAQYGIWQECFLLSQQSSNFLCLQDVSAKNEEGNTPLHYACLNGHIDTVKLLMMHGASPSDLNRCGTTIMGMSAFTSSLPCASQ